MVNTAVCKTAIRRFESDSRLMSKEKDSGFRQEMGNWSIAGGVVAGIIGLVTNPELIVGGIALLFGGLYLRKK